MDHEWKFPPCFNSEADFALWRDGPYQETLPAQHCTDCLPSFKMRMAKAGRCEHPETVFRFDNETGFEPGDEGVAISGAWKREVLPKVIRMVKVRRKPWVPAISAPAPEEPPAASKLPLCKCGAPCEFYSIKAGFSTACASCNAKNAERQRQARKRDGRDYFQEQQRLLRERMNFGR